MEFCFLQSYQSVSQLSWSLEDPGELLKEWSGVCVEVELGAEDAEDWGELVVEDAEDWGELVIEDSGELVIEDIEVSGELVIEDWGELVVEDSDELVSVGTVKDVDDSVNPV